MIQRPTLLIISMNSILFNYNVSSSKMVTIYIFNNNIILGFLIILLYLLSNIMPYPFVYGYVQQKLNKVPNCKHSELANEIVSNIKEYRSY